MENLTITRSNFKTQRVAYGITLKDISKDCGLSESTINNFEKCVGKYTDTNARSYNATIMIKSLEKLVEEKINNSFEPFDDIKAKQWSHKGGRKVSDISRATISEYVKLYCVDNNIQLKEFCDMCGVGANYFFSSRPADFVSEDHLRKILTATGWDKDQIKSGYISKKENKSCVAGVITDKTISNVKLSCEDGKFYKEYDILKHVRKEVSKEEFMKEVSEYGCS